MIPGSNAWLGRLRSRDIDGRLKVLFKQRERFWNGVTDNGREFASAVALEV
jgi:hypothetical protein